MNRPSPAPDVVGVLLAGGQSSRMGGGDKCLIEIDGRPLLAHAIERLRPQVSRLVLSANGDAARFDAFGLPVVADRGPGHSGPLAGILAGMEWARVNAPEASLIATVATDTPFFPPDLVERLKAALEDRESIAFARSAGRGHPVFGLFPVGLVDDLARFIVASPTLSVMAWIVRHRRSVVEFDAAEGGGLDPFVNINSPDDLASIRSALASGG